MTAQQLKNSILQMAVQGKLVPQDPNDEPASVLLERIRAEKERLIKEKKIKREKNPSVIFKGADNTPYEKIGDEVRSLADEVPFDIPDSWEWVRLGNISSYAETKQKVNATSADPSIWGLDLEDIEKGGRLLEYKTVGERKAVGDKTVFTKGDILYSKLRPYLLKILVAPDDGICTPEIVPFRVYGGIDPSYIVNYLKSPYVDNLINSITYGVKMPRVGTETMTSLLVPIPPLEEQRRIVEKIDEVASAVSAYDVAYQKNEALNSTFPETLKKSILQEAVQGKLVPQDPSDEPAEALLEHIRAEKQRLVKEGEIKKDKYESVIFRRDNSHYEKLDGIERCIDDEIPFDLPESWEWVRFFSVVDIATNLVRPEEYADYIHIAPDNIEKATGTLFECHTVQQDKVVSPNHLFYKGQIIYSKIRPLLRKAVIAPFDGLCSADMYPLNTAINRKYLLRYMLSDAFNLQVATAMSSRVKMPKINQDELSKILIPIPPMQEQERIVSKIEELFNKITLI
ncbi:restriction endonuclease subunit S [Flavonifractor plautii]|uniref:restriction endonuclease subunit S n=1 Tax=Flavonifractor plautii TaxID=292800 RepID=UPI00232E0B73|nr:restriction endonuclease subunit S [Flavonifractor plautii]MDB7897894.1 restriction endonuclease subunit S [Flavonifractor plautii]